MLVNTLLSLTFGVLSSAMVVISALSINRMRLLVFALLGSVLAVIQFLFMPLEESKAGLVLCALAVLRGIYWIAAEKFTRLNHWLAPTVFIVSSILLWGAVVGKEEWDSMALIPLIGMVFSLMAFYFQNMVILKMFFAATSGAWIIYEFLTGAYGAMVGEAFTIVSNLLAIAIIMRSTKNDKEPKEIETIIKDAVTTSIPVITQSIPVLNTTQPLPVITQSHKIL